MQSLSPCATQLESFSRDLLVAHNQKIPAELSSYFEFRDQCIDTKNNSPSHHSGHSSAAPQLGSDTFLSSTPLLLDWSLFQDVFQQTSLCPQNIQPFLATCESIYQLSSTCLHQSTRASIWETTQSCFLPYLQEASPRMGHGGLAHAVSKALDASHRLVHPPAQEKPQEGLYVILSPPADASVNDLCTQAMQAVAGGATLLQLRCKAHPRHQIVEYASACGRLLRPYRIPFLINDDPDLVDLSYSAGVHVGLSDPSVKRCREKLGPHAMIGASSHTKMDRQKILSGEHPTYLAVGPIFESSTKAGHAECVGLSQLREAAHESPVPICAIGGLDTPARIASVAKAGARWAAVVSVFSRSSHPIWTCAQLSAVFHSTKDLS